MIRMAMLKLEFTFMILRSKWMTTAIIFHCLGYAWALSYYYMHQMKSENIVQCVHLRSKRIPSIFPKVNMVHRELITVWVWNKYFPLLQCKSTDFRNSRLYSDATPAIINILANQEVASNFHVYCVTEQVENEWNGLRDCMNYNYLFNHYRIWQISVWIKAGKIYHIALIWKDWNSFHLSNIDGKHSFSIVVKQRAPASYNIPMYL